jgi:hypothetical protein
VCVCVSLSLCVFLINSVVNIRISQHGILAYQVTSHQVGPYPHTSFYITHYIMALRSILTDCMVITYVPFLIVSAERQLSFHQCF